MELVFSNLPLGSPDLGSAIAASRSARNLTTRRRKAEGSAARDAERVSRAQRRKADKELEKLLKWRFRCQVPKENRPRISKRMRLDLFHRAVDGILGKAGTSDSKGPDRLYSIHFDFTPRGFGSKTGRRWRPGEAARAGLYITRPEGLEGGEDGWWSNFAEDREELVAFLRALEQVEREDRVNANVYVSEIIALPAELDAEQRRTAARAHIEPLEARGLPIVVGMHLPDPGGDQRNYHCHIVYSLRGFERHGAYDWSFELGKQGDINTGEGIRARRAHAVESVNAALSDAGVDKRYTALSNAARGMRRPGRKVGQEQTWAHRRLEASEQREAKLQKAIEAIAWVSDTLTQAAGDAAAVGAEVLEALQARSAELWVPSAESLPDVAAHLSDVREGMTRICGGAGEEVGRLEARLTQQRERRRAAAREKLVRQDGRRKAVAAAAAETLAVVRAGVHARVVQYRATVNLRLGQSVASLYDLTQAIARARARDEANAAAQARSARLGRLKSLIAAAAVQVARDRPTVMNRLCAARSRIQMHLSAAASALAELEPQVRASLLGQRSAAQGADRDVGEALKAANCGLTARLQDRSKAPPGQRSSELAEVGSTLRVRLAGRRHAANAYLEGAASSLRALEHARHDAASRQRPEANFPPEGRRVSPPQDPARAAAVKAYAEFVRTDDTIRIVSAGGVDRVDVESLPNEWKFHGPAFEDEPEVTAAVGAALERSRAKEASERRRAEADRSLAEILEQVESAKVRPVYRDGGYWRVSEGVLNERLRGFLPMWIYGSEVQEALEKVAYKWWNRERAAEVAARSARASPGFAPPAQRAQEPPQAVAPAREVTSLDSEPDNWTEILDRFTKDQNQR